MGMMNGIYFGNVRALWLIPILAMLIVFFNVLIKFHRKKLEAWIHPDLWANMIPDFSKNVLTLKNTFLSFAFLFLTFALSRPQWGEIDQVINTRGMDIIFLMDLSTSMLAEDASPSRLSRAQSFIKKTLPLIESDRVGLVGFAGSAQLSVPLTNDFQYLAEVVDTLDPSAISNQGTNIGDAIEAATKALDRAGEDDHKNSRAIVLITDGEDFGDSALTAARKIKDFGAGFFAFSVGTTEGAPIPLRNEGGILQSYKKDSSDKPILSKVNKDLLQKIAEEAGGSFLELINPDDASYTLAKALQKFSHGTLQEQHVVTHIERFEWFLALGVFFLLLYLSTGYRKARLIFSLLLGGLIAPGQWSSAAETSSLKGYWKNKKATQSFEDKKFEDSAKLFQEAEIEDPENPALDYNTGTALGQGKKTEDAINQLQAATQKSLNQGDYGTASKSLFNEGIAQMENKNLPEAYDRLTKSIEMAKISNQPEIEKRAREELTRLAIKQEQEKQQKQQQGDQKEQKDGQDQKNQKDQKGGDKPQSGSGQEKDQNTTQDGMNGKDVAKKREFRSGTLSKDTAESIMNDLSDREKQLYHHRMKDGRRREQPHGNDW